MLNQSVAYLFITIIGLSGSYTIYHYTARSVGLAFIIFALWQLLTFFMIIYAYEAAKRKNISMLNELVTGFQKGQEKRVQVAHLDEDFALLARNIKGIKREFEEETHSYKHAHHRFLHILQNITSGVILLDRSGRIQFINMTGEDIFQLSRVELLAKTHWKIGRDSGLSEKIEEVRKNKEKITCEIQLNYPFYRLLETTISPTLNQRGEVEEIVILMHDITQRERMEQLRKEFVANVSHELKTPLTSIKGFTETLLQGVEDNKYREQFLNIIYRESTRLHELVDNLLDLSVIESNGIDMSETNLVQVIKQAIEEMRFIANEKKIQLHFAPTQSSVYMLADQNRMKQVLINLLSNSIKYSETNKTVTVQLKQMDHEILLVVKDQGIGIPSEHIERVFERFYRVDSSRNHKSGGRGIGLSIVKQIVKQHHGTIKIKSAVNVGTEISIVFNTLLRS